MPLSFLRVTYPLFRCTPHWTQEEKLWIAAETFPPVVVRSYRKAKQLKRDTKRLRHLGYDLTYQTWDWSGSGRWHATFKQRRSLSVRYKRKQ